MKPKLVHGLLLIVSVVFLLVPAWVTGQPQPSDPSARQRDRGRPATPADRQDEQGATEDGMPEIGPRAFGFDRPERIRPRPLWRLGVYAFNSPTGVVVHRVAPGSPAARAGLEPGDRILTVSGFQVGIVGNQIYYLGEELQRQADGRGRVLLLAQNVRNRRLLNLDVQLERRRWGGPAPGEPFEPGAERLGARSSSF